MYEPPVCNGTISYPGGVVQPVNPYYFSGDAECSAVMAAVTAATDKLTGQPIVPSGTTPTIVDRTYSSETPGADGRKRNAIEWTEDGPNGPVTFSINVEWAYVDLQRFTAPNWYKDSVDGDVQIR